MEAWIESGGLGILHIPKNIFRGHSSSQVKANSEGKPTSSKVNIGDVDIKKVWGMMSLAAFQMSKSANKAKKSVESRRAVEF